jgi:hypothetical protein
LPKITDLFNSGDEVIEIMRHLMVEKFENENDWIPFGQVNHLELEKMYPDE